MGILTGPLWRSLGRAWTADSALGLLVIGGLMAPADSAGQVPVVETPPLVRTPSSVRHVPTGPGEPATLSPRDAHSATLSMLRRALDLAGVVAHDSNPSGVACIGVGWNMTATDPDSTTMADLRAAFGGVVVPRSACRYTLSASDHGPPIVVERTTNKPATMLWAGSPRLHADSSWTMWLGYSTTWYMSAMYQCRLQASPSGPEIDWCRIRGGSRSVGSH